jgi:pimeloyl-ACP methyl ester carboxylesterase
MTNSTSAPTQYVDVPGGRLAYDEAGEGRALLLLHAGVTDRRMWDDVLPALARSHRVVRYDTRGYGETRQLEDVPYSNRADAIAVLDHLGIERATIVGVSRAGSIALDTALEFPSRISGVVHVAGGVGGFETDVTPEEEAAFEESERLEEARDWPALVDAELRLWVDGLGQPSDRVAPAVRERVREMLVDLHRDHADEPLDQVIVLEPRAAARLSELRVPVLVISGELDTPETNAAGRYLAENLPGARHEVIAGVAHLPPMERPAAFTSIVESFLDANGL